MINGNALSTFLKGLLHCPISAELQARREELLASHRLERQEDKINQREEERGQQRDDLGGGHRHQRLWRVQNAPDQDGPSQEDPQHQELLPALAARQQGEHGAVRLRAAQLLVPHLLRPQEPHAGAGAADAGPGAVLGAARPLLPPGNQNYNITKLVIVDLFSVKR